MSPTIVTAAPQVTTSSANMLIVPGQSVGGLTLGLSKEQVIDILGHPEKVDVDPNWKAERWTYERFATELMFSENRAVLAIRTFNPLVKNREGLNPDFLFGYARRTSRTRRMSLLMRVCGR